MPRDKDRYEEGRGSGRDRDRDGSSRGNSSKDYGGRAERDRRGEDGGDGGGRSRDKDRGRSDRDRDRKKRHASRSTSRERASASSKKQERKINMSYRDEGEPEDDDEAYAHGAAAPVIDPEKIKPSVEENKGEISMTVEETNRVRAMLGLKPLNVGGAGKPTQEQVAVENMRQKREDEKKAQDLKDIEARLQKTRTKRLLNEKLKGDTLGEVKDGEEEVFSAADWVKRSRKKQTQVEEERLLAAQRARILEEQEMEMAMAGGSNDDANSMKKKKSKYGADNLAGLKVTHGAGAFESGDSVILTLKDQAILDEDEHGRVTGLAEHDDELENVHMKEAERREELQKEAVRAKRGPYQAYDDEEFEGDVGPGAKRKVLSHYDEVKQEGAKLTLGQGGAATDGSSNAAGGAEGQGGEEKKVLESLKVEIKDASEYYTTEEMAKFKKPKKMRKKQKLRRRDQDGASSSLGLEASIANGNGSGGTSASNGAAAVAVTAAGVASNGGGDHGSRAARAARLAASAEDEVAARKARFETAVARAGERANEKLKDSFGKPPVPPVQKARLPEKDPMAFAEELDSDLGLSLARARRLAQLKDQAKRRKSRDVGEVVREAMSKIVKAEVGSAPEPGQTGARNGSGASSMEVEGGGDVSVKKEEDEGMVFTSTTEFTSRLQATLEERKRDNIAAAEKQRIKEEREVETKTAKLKNRDAMDVDKEQEDEDVDEEEMAALDNEANIAKKKRSRWTTEGGDDDEVDEEELEAMLEGTKDDSDEDEQLAFLHKQPLAKDGMAATLALLRPSGVLQDKFHRSGRAKDARKHHGEEDETREERESGAKLEYRDEWGRALTRKEAWRNLNYQFHGFGSGKKKQEKRLKQVAEEKKKERAMDLQRLRTLQQTQEVTKQAFVVVQGGSHAGAALPPPPPSVDLQKKVKDSKRDAKVKSETPSR